MALRSICDILFSLVGFWCFACLIVITLARAQTRETAWSRKFVTSLFVPSFVVCRGIAALFDRSASGFSGRYGSDSRHGIDEWNRSSWTRSDTSAPSIDEARNVPLTQTWCPLDFGLWRLWPASIAGEQKHSRTILSGHRQLVAKSSTIRQTATWKGHSWTGWPRLAPCDVCSTPQLRAIRKATPVAAPAMRCARRTLGLRGGRTRHVPASASGARTS
jgi:hypothetical protein